MKLSNRLWNAIAYRFADRDEDPMTTVWAKITVNDPEKRKRHFFRDIALNPAEEQAVTKLITGPSDYYLEYVVRHERAANPEFAALGDLR